MASDRIFGLVVVIGALAYFAGALQVQTSFLSDPLGPRAFPILVSAAMGLCGLAMIWKPDGEPDWPAGKAWIGMSAALVLLIGYAYAIGPMGFLLSTAIAAGGISWLIDPRPLHAAATGVGLSAGLFIIFKYGLGLGLFALPRALMG